VKALLNLYAEIFDGLRGYYVRKKGDSSGASFMAVSALSALLVFNVGVTLSLVDILIFGRLVAAPWVLSNRAWIVLASVGAFFLNRGIAKATGVYGRRGPARTTRWVVPFQYYLVATAINFVITTILVISRVPRAG
jgi:hypothetical protein